MSHRSNEDFPGPEDFPLGSVESRAAARALLNDRERNTVHRVIVMSLPHRGGNTGEIHIHPWQEWGDEMARLVCCDPGTSWEEIERLLPATPAYIVSCIGGLRRATP